MHNCPGGMRRTNEIIIRMCSQSSFRWSKAPDGKSCSGASCKAPWRTHPNSSSRQSMVQIFLLFYQSKITNIFEPLIVMMDDSDVPCRPYRAACPTGSLRAHPDHMIHITSKPNYYLLMTSRAH